MCVKLLIISVAVSLGAQIPISIRNFIYSVFFLPSHNVDKELAPFVFAGWTLNFEMFFYVICCSCLLISRRFFFPLACTFVSVTVLLGAGLRSLDYSTEHTL